MLGRRSVEVDGMVWWLLLLLLLLPLYPLVEAGTAAWSLWLLWTTTTTYAEAVSMIVVASPFFAPVGPNKTLVEVRFVCSVSGEA